jgi:hypothetical protein
VTVLAPRGTALARALLTAAATAVVLSATPAAAQGGCGGVQRASPPGWHRSYLAPLAIGDSTMLFALPALASEGFEVNAHGCRQFDEALTLMRGLSAEHLLPHLVVIALGADGSVTASDIRQTIQILGPRRVLFLVTPRELGGGSGSDATVVRNEGRWRRPQVHVLDWVSYSQGHGSWFQPDGLHLTFSGADAFSRLLARARKFQVAPVKHRPPPAAKRP